MSVAAEGAARPLPAGVDAAAYRIVQEALTNAVRHSGGRAASVQLRYGDDLVIEVDDGGGAVRASAAARPGSRRRHGERPRGWPSGPGARRHGRRGAPAGRRVPGAGAAARREGGVIRVALADDQALVRSGFAALLDAEDDISVVGGGRRLRGGAAGAGQKPDVLLMDIRMPGLDGIAATREIAADPALAAVHVLILTTFGLDEYIFDALRAGAAGFLVKDTDAAELIRAVRVIASGEALLSPGVTRRLIAEFAARTRPADARRGPS